MSQKYIDFIPSKKPPVQASTSRASQPTATPRAANSPAPRASRSTAHSAQPRSHEVAAKPAQPSASQTHSSASAKNSFSIKKEPAYGVIEDFHPKFVKTEVEKRPLSRNHFATPASELSELKAQNIKKHSRKPSTEPSTPAATDQQSLRIPKSPFIAKAKVAKRPLSKNVYTKPAQPAKEPAAGPVTIISKPEPEGKAGMAIAIILTIILGAVAGTIAFLIMPK